MIEFTYLKTTQQHTQCKPCNLPKKEIIKKAETLRNNKFKTKNNILNIEKTLKTINATTHYMEKHEYKKCKINLLKDIDEIHIFIPIMENEKKIRHIIAHTIGHLALHCPNNQQKYTDTKNKEELIEKEAKTFANAFLIPRRKINELKKINYKTTKEIANKLQVEHKRIIQRIKGE